MTTHRSAVAQFNPSVYSGEVEHARANPTLTNGSMYKDDVGGLYKYFTLPNTSILIVAYPLRPSLNGTTVYEGDSRFPGMARNLETKGVLVPETEEQKETQTAMTTPPAPMPYSVGPTSSPPPLSPSPSVGTGGGSSSGPQPSAFYEEDWFPWVLGGVILTAVAGAAIILWPGPKPAEVLD